MLTYICAIYIAVCEEVCGKPNLFDDQLYIMADIKSMDDVRELIKKQEEVTRLEDRVKAWMKKVQEVYYFILKPSAFSHSFAYSINLVLTLSMICIYIFLLAILAILVWNQLVFEKASVNYMCSTIPLQLKTASPDFSAMQIV